MPISPAETTSPVDQPVANSTPYQARATTIVSSIKPKSVVNVRTTDDDVRSDVTSVSQTGPGSAKQCVVSSKSELTNADP